MPMRVVGGEVGGRSLKGPPQRSVRPTSDRVREALFEVLAARGIEMGNVLDLYSGTGALGIEALSRGAEHCDFVEADARTADVIRENLALTGLATRARVFPIPVARVLGRLTGPYDLVVADPPYEYDRAEKELTDLISSGLVAEDAAIAVEHSKRRNWPEELAGRQKAFSRRYGDTVVTLYQ